MSLVPTELPDRQPPLPENAAPLILALDTSSKATSIVATRGQGVIFSFGAVLDDNRSARLWGIVDFLLTESGLKLADVDLFAVCIGPGGFTGLRVGMTAAKGFAEATGKPLIGVTSLEATAAALEEMKEAASLVCVLNNAYKNEVYSQLFSFDEAGVPVSENEPTVGEVRTAIERVAGRDSIIFIGDAVIEKHGEILALMDEFQKPDPAQAMTIRVRLAPGQQFLATYIARIADFRYKVGSIAPPADLRACYVRGADIKIKQQV